VEKDCIINEIDIMNALDKLIGAGLRTNQTDWQHGMLLITSRASMEMVQKALMAGFNNLIAISAPTKMAIDLAQQHGLCLIGLAKPEKWTIYSYPSRISEAISTDHVAE
jgi:FdhD protein